jgi:hypothetical protein
MNGIKFYEFLLNFYSENGQPCYGNYSFCCWLDKNDGTQSFQFNGNHPLKSIPKAWLVDAKITINNREIIDRNWFNNNYNQNNFNDCRVNITLLLFDNY